MMLLSVLCGVAYSLILAILWKDDELMKMSSYKLMFALGVFDTVQCIPHFITGIFTIRQSVFHPAFAKTLGVIATPAYVAYAMLTVVLAFSRFLQLYSPRLDAVLFNIKKVNYWIIFGASFWLVFVIALSTPWATIRYLPELYSWDYDYTLKCSYWVQKCEMVIELGTIILSAFFYALVIAALYRTRKRFLTRSNCHAEIKILIQALVITVYCTVLNFLWHNSQLVLPDSIWSYMGLNFMWILNSGVHPVIYFIVNRTIRERVSVRRTLPSISKSHIFTRIPNLNNTCEPDKNKLMRTCFDGDQTLGAAMATSTKLQFVS
ncbi:hypothetical protein Q1695_008251 [Nippostrongylus brasiliensis]|nr:hypothetical protein Q1695_008251 [Nippostrongylus brasiliensis]